MAFLSKVGNILKQSVSRQSVASEVSQVKFSAFQALRCMCSSVSGPKIFIGGLSFQMDEQSLREECAKYGYIIDARLIVDRETGKSRGYGFVTFGSNEEASSAIQAMDGKDLLGRIVRVNYATERRAGGGYGGGYGGGGYGGAGGYSGGGGGYSGGGGNYGGGGGNYGGGGGGYSGGGGNYGGGGGGYSGGGGNYGGGSDYTSNYGGNNSFENSATTGGGGFGSVAGGAGGSEHFGSGFGGDSASDQYDGNSGSGFGGNTRSNVDEGNFKDDDDSDYAKRA